MSTCNVYLDESGDLGWKFDKPFSKGGSSRYLTIANLIIPKELIHLPKRIAKAIKIRANIEGELKGKDLTIPLKKIFSQKVCGLLEKDSRIRVSVITVNKQRVQSHMREDPNKLYNYMVNFALLEKVTGYTSVNFTPDPRSVKVKSQNSLTDYLQTKLWFEMNALTKINDMAMESHHNLNLQFIDVISNIVWSYYELGQEDPFNILGTNIETKRLFF